MLEPPLSHGELSHTLICESDVPEYTHWDRSVMEMWIKTSPSGRQFALAHQSKQPVAIQRAIARTGN